MTPTQFCIHFVLAALATWRVTHLLANEDGPADLVVKLRSALGDSLVGKLMDCFKCLSLWIAAPAALFVTRTPLNWLMVWLALSGAACLLQRFAPEPAEAQPIQQTSEGDVRHVLWPEAIYPAECPFISGENLPAVEPAYPAHGAEPSRSGRYDA
jgi:hypothetical protein